jgi:ATP-dependent helicase/nuclease subunit A
VSYAANTLAELRAIKDRVLVADLVRESMERTGYDAALLAEFMGGRKLANLRKLIDQARAFDRSGMFSLADFITQLSEFVARQPDEPLAATSPETADVVRLMTVHQAKGLEFPVVVVPDLDRRLVGSRSSVAFTPQLGPMVKMPSGASGYDLHAIVERKEEQDELVRLLYVASTRAADYLILSSGLTELGSFRGPWGELLSRRFDSLTGGLRAELPSGYGTPHIKVTVSEPPLADTKTVGRRRTDLKQVIERVAEAADKGNVNVPQYLGPIATDLTARRQYSFSRLSGQVHETKEFESTEDTVHSPAQLDPLGLGTLVHAVLAEVDFFALADVESLVRRLAPRHLPDVKDGLAEPIAMIRRFLNSPRAAEIAVAKEVHPELEFLLAWPPASSPAKKRAAKQAEATLPDPRTERGDDVGSATASSETQAPQAPVYFQGFIDCVYKDRRGGWHVVDYKTNRVSRESLDSVAAQYEMQMLLYGLAVEQILGHRPRSLVLHFLRPSLERHFDWDAAARKRIVRMVDRSLADYVGIRGVQEFAWQEHIRC